MSVTLRPYQDELVRKISTELDFGVRRSLTVLPTGGGKTVVFVAIARDYNRGGALIISHRREIVAQTCAKLSSIGLPYGVIQSGNEKGLRPFANVQVASVQTLHARAIRSESMLMPRADIVIIDEAHHVPAATYQKVLEKYPNARVLGFTATPCRGDGRGLGGDFDKIIEGPQVAELIHLGFLVRSRVYSTEVNLRGLKTVAGDYAKGELEHRMNTDRLVGDVVTQWIKRAEGRPTVVFASGVGHSRHIVGEFLSAGIRADHIDGTTPKDERDAILARLASGDLTVVSNAMVLTEGWDLPITSCCVLARPTKQMGLFRQMIGRVLRPAEGKADAIILDHAGAVHSHGLPEDRVEWTLDPDKRASAPEHEKRKSDREMKLIECTECGALRKGGLPCPACGFLPKRPKEFVPFIDADLVEVGARTNRPTQADVQDFFAQLLWIAQEQGYKLGWAFHKAKAKFQRFGLAPHGSPTPKKPEPATLSWVRSRNIAFAKSRRAA